MIFLSVTEKGAADLRGQIVLKNTDLRHLLSI